MDQYEKLYAKVDKVFEGTPNTPSALAVKSEILENLTAKYDDLRGMGISEDEAIKQVVDSIGDISELFGMQKAQDPAQTADESAQPKKAPAPQKVKIYNTYPPEKVSQGRAIQKALIALAVALYILSIVAPILSSVGLPEAFGVSLMFGMWGLATAMIVGSGICLPWANPIGKLLLSLGVGCYLWAFIPTFLLESVSEGLAVSLMFAGWALATMLVIFSTNFKRKGLPTSDGKRIVVETPKPDDLPPDLNAIYKPISTILAMLTLVIYLAVSFHTFGWAYTWIIWVIYGCVCEIVKAILWLIFRARRDV